MFYVFLVGLAKLHCGATPPSVMVLFNYASKAYVTISLALNKRFTFEKLPLPSFHSPVVIVSKGQAVALFAHNGSQ